MQIHLPPLNVQDVYEGQKAYRRGASCAARFAYRSVFWVLAVPTFGLGMFLIFFRDRIDLGAMLIVLGALFFCSLFFRRQRSAARYLRKNPNLQREYKAEFSEEGIEVWGSELHAKIGWSNLQKWGESKTVFLVYPQSTIYNIYPKRLFKQDEIDEFRDLLRRKIPRK